MQHVILLPDLGQTTSEARVLQWWKQPGEKVLRGEPLLAVETDKVDMDVESFVDGYLRLVLVEAGAVATALRPVAILTDSPEEPYEAPSGTPNVSTVPQPTGAASASVPSNRIAAVPAAKSMARELGIELGGISGTGPGGLIVRKDVERFAGERHIAYSRGFSAMAAIATASKRDIPHFYASLDVDTHAAETWRANWNAKHSGLRASLNDIFVRCAAKALFDVPRLNTRLHNGEYQPRATPDILLIIARESGLALVPVLGPQALPWGQFLDVMKIAVQKGLLGSAAAANAHGSRPLLAISNLGMHGVKEFAAIIPPGCTSVLAIGAVRDAPVVQNGRLEAGRICTLTLSADHRVVDGITAALFLQRMQHHLSSL
jgi:pyruvate dehydrogenase E2 component (dihydrolipoamide acetyltransferase)